MKGKQGSAGRAAILGFLTVSLGSCSYSFGIKFSGYGPNIRLEFRDDGMFRRSRLAACLKELNVYELPGPTGQPEQLVWKIRASGRCTKLTGLDIGHVPSGYIEEANRLPLKIGGRYQAEARAEKEYLDAGLSSHWFVCREFPQETGWKNEYELRELPASCIR
jgi:hypothetical protein